MNTSPSIDDLIESVIQAIDDEIVPALGNPKAFATAAMMQSLLQTVRQVLPVYDHYLVDEHNAMTGVLARVGDAIAGEGGSDEVDAAVGRMTERAHTLGQRPDLPPPPDRAELMAAHRELTEALAATVADLDVLQRAGSTAADDALTTLRAHMGPRYLRDTATVVVGEGMIGRG